MKTRPEMIYEFMVALAGAMSVLEESTESLDERDIANCILEQAKQLTNVYFEEMSA
jgi:hypothetical protein